MIRTETVKDGRLAPWGLLCVPAESDLGWYSPWAIKGGNRGSGLCTRSSPLAVKSEIIAPGSGHDVAALVWGETYLMTYLPYTSYCLYWALLWYLGHLFLVFHGTPLVFIRWCWFDFKCGQSSSISKAFWFLTPWAVEALLFTRPLTPWVLHIRWLVSINSLLHSSCFAG